jgi:hypothetical protein
MKTIILNDMNSSSESIIPYGLRLAKAMESEVDILHTIDPRTHQGTYSSVSDSQSISPGQTLSQAETMRHEKHRVSRELDKLLSAEASRLNYPLKINRVIAKNSLEEELEKQVELNAQCLLVVNAEGDEEMLENTAEIIRFISRLNVPALVVPPGEKFKPFTSALMPLNLDHNNFSAFSNLKFMLDHFNLSIDAVGVATNGNYTEMELKAIAWKDAVSEFYFKDANLKTNILEGKDFTNTISNYFRRNKRELLVMVAAGDNNKSAVLNTVLLLKSVQRPTLVYFSN